MKWFVTAANRLNHVDIYRWDGKDLTLAKRIPTGKTPSHLWIDSQQHHGLRRPCRTATSWSPSTWPRRRSSGASRPARCRPTSSARRTTRPLLVGLTGGDGVEVYDVSGDAAALRQAASRPATGAHAFRAAGDRRHVFVSNRVANTISKIDYQTLQVVDQLSRRPAARTAWTCSADGKLPAGHLALGPQADRDRHRRRARWCARSAWASRRMASGRWTMRRGSEPGAPAVLAAVARLAAVACVPALALQAAAQRCAKPRLPDLRHRPHGRGAAGGRGAEPPAGARSPSSPPTRRTQEGDGSLGDALGALVEGAGRRGPRVRLAHLGPRLLARRPARHGAALPRAALGRAATRAGLHLGRAAQYCAEIDQAARAAAGDHRQASRCRCSAHRAARPRRKLLAAAKACGYEHVGWSPAGFLGDELPSETSSNEALLKKALRDIRAGDILLAHLGIWSRKDPWAPAVLEPLIVGLKAQGLLFCARCASTRPTATGSPRVQVSRCSGSMRPFRQGPAVAVRDRRAADHVRARPGQPAGRRLRGHRLAAGRPAADRRDAGRSSGRCSAGGRWSRSRTAARCASTCSTR